MATVFHYADAHGNDVKLRQGPLLRWIREHATPDLIVYGGDVYNDGTPDDFQVMLAAMGGNVSRVCHTPGNHCWHTKAQGANGVRYPSGYEAFWRGFAPPASAQPIDTTKAGGGRYEHYVDLEGWRLIFLDTGPCEDDQAPWPMGDASRLEWLKSALDTGSRATLVFAHHSRLSRGKHGDIDEVNGLWQALFDENGKPLAAATFAGHDHTLSVYGPRPRLDPEKESVEFARGIHVIVNGAGGRNHDVAWRGTRPDLISDDDNYCLTRITLIDATHAIVDFISFGPKGEQPAAAPELLFSLPISL